MKFSYFPLIILFNLKYFLSKINILFKLSYTYCLYVKLLQSCPTLRDPMACSLPGSSVHEIFPARILEWDAMPSFRGSSQLSVPGMEATSLMSAALAGGYTKNMGSSTLIFCQRIYYLIFQYFKIFNLLRIILWTCLWPILLNVQVCFKIVCTLWTLYIIFYKIY